MSGRRLLAMLCVLALVGGMGLAARGEAIRFRIFEWLPEGDAGLREQIVKFFHIDEAHLPALALLDNETMAIVNSGGVPSAAAYAPLRVDGLLPVWPDGPGPGCFTLRFEARWLGEGRPPRAGVTFLTERLDFVPKPEWARYGVSVSVPGPVGPASVAFSLRARHGRLEVRGLQLTRLSFRPLRAESYPRGSFLARHGTSGRGQLGIALAGVVPSDLSLRFKEIGADSGDASVPDGPGVPFASGQRRGAISGISPDPGSGAKFTATMSTFDVDLPQATPRSGHSPPAGVRWWLMDGEGRVALAGDAFLPPPLRPAPGPRRRDVRIDPEGTMIVEGKKRLPLGIYLHESSERAIDDAAAVGLDLVLMPPAPNTEALVKHARAKGLEVILESSVPSEREKIEPTVRDLVRQYASLPVLAWTAVDEPDLRPGYAHTIEAIHRAFAAADSRPLYQANHSPSSFARYGSACDILAVDPYPVATVPSPLATVGSWMDRARAAMLDGGSVSGARAGTRDGGAVSAARAATRDGGSVPAARAATRDGDAVSASRAGRSPWLIQQAFAEAPIWSRPPTPAELHAMTWIGLNHGARGIVYYTLHEILNPATPDHQWDLRRTDLWTEIRRETAEIRSVEKWLTLGQPQHPAVTGPIDAAWWVADGDGLLALVNLSDRAAHGSVRLDTGKATSLTPLSSVPATALSKGAWAVELPAYKVALFRTIPTAADR